MRANRKLPLDEDGNPIEEEEEEAAKHKIIVKLDTVQRVCDNEDNVQHEIA